jgi:hypothetical protein
VASPSALEAFFKMREYNSADERDIAVKERNRMTSTYTIKTCFKFDTALEQYISSDTKNKYVCGIYKDDLQKTALIHYQGESFVVKPGYQK